MGTGLIFVTIHIKSWMYSLDLVPDYENNDKNYKFLFLLTVFTTAE